jgi:transposase
MALNEKLLELHDKLLIGLESTAHYGENLIFYLCGEGYQIAVLNPLQTASLRKSAIRKTKTDKVDALLIAKTLMMGNYALVQPRDLQLLKLRGLCQTRQNLTLLRTRSKIQMSTFVDQIFPELNGFFRAGLHIKTAHELLKRHTSPKEIKSLHLTYLSNLLRNSSRGKYTKSDAINLRTLAASSIGTDSPALSLQIGQTIAQIELFSAQRDQVDAQIAVLMDELDSVIMSVPGIGHLNGAMILSCVGNVSRFPASCKLLAYAGLDPAVIQSGSFSARTTRMSKRGNSMLRYALINAAHNVVLNNNTFRLYYDSKISQGKSHYCALGHTAHKLVRVLFTMLSKNLRFDLP